MHVRIDRERYDIPISTGWFTSGAIPAYALFLTVRFSEEERHLITYTGIGQLCFFQAPIPPGTDENEAKRMKENGYGQFFTADLLGMADKTFIGVWPDVVAVDEADAFLRIKLTELADNLARESGDTATVFEP